MFTVGHHPWVFASGILGNVTSFLVYLAPIPTFARVIRKKSTEDFQSVPYIIALFSGMLWMYYGLVQPTAAFLLIINSFGCFIETVYLTIYIIYAPRKARIFTLRLILLINVGGMCLIVLATNFIVKGAAHRARAVGWVCLVFAVSVFAAPLSIVRLVIKTKSVEFMPLPLSICLTLSAIGWFFYGILQLDFNIAMPNTLGFIFGVLQIILYFMYRKNTPVTKEAKLPEQVIDIVKLNPNTTPDIHSVTTPQQLNFDGNEGGNQQINAHNQTGHAEEGFGGSNRV